MPRSMRSHMPSHEAREKSDESTVQTAGHPAGRSSYGTEQLIVEAR